MNESPGAISQARAGIPARLGRETARSPPARAGDPPAKSATRGRHKR